MVADAETVGRRIAEVRTRAGLTQAQVAAAATLERSALAKIESGTRRVSAVELAQLAQALETRIEWFVEDGPEALISRRNIQEPGSPSPRIDELIERLAHNVEFVAGLDDRLRLEAPVAQDVPTSVAGAEALAETAREMMGLNQLEPVLNLAEKLAYLGLLAFSFDVGPETADAATILLRHGAVAAVNGQRHTGRRRLALAHELVHYLVADQFTIDWRITEFPDADQREHLFDRCARAFLLPAQAIRGAWAKAAEGAVDSRTLAVQTASRFRVDMSTLARRLLELGLVSYAEGARLRQVRTTQADIVELNLVVGDELGAPELPRDYVLAVLRLYRSETVSIERALDLLFDTWDESMLPDLPERSQDEIWQYV